MGYLVAKFRYSTKWCYRYEISLRESYREDGKVKKRETYLMTYYLPWITNNSSHPQIDREYPDQYENISPTHMKYFNEDETLMGRIVEKVKQSEIKRLKKIELRKELFDFWCDQIKCITDTFCRNENKQMEFFYFVNNQMRTMDYVRYSKEYFYQNKDRFTKKIHELYIEFDNENSLKEDTDN